MSDSYEDGRSGKGKNRLEDLTNASLGTNNMEGEHTSFDWDGQIRLGTQIIHFGQTICGGDTQSLFKGHIFGKHIRTH